MAAINIGRHYVDGISRKELFRLARENHLIKNVDHWFEYHQTRNMTSHIYNEEMAKDVYQTALRFLGDAEALLEELRQRND